MFVDRRLPVVFGLLAVAVSSFTASCTTRTPDGLTEVSELPFTVRMPGTPTRKESTFDSKIGIIRSIGFQLNTIAYSYVFVVESYAPEYVDKLAPETAIAFARDNVFSHHHDKIRNSRRLEFRGYPAVDFEIEVPPDQNAKAGTSTKRAICRVVLVRNRAIGLALMGEPGSFPPETAMAYFDTFQIEP
jgi:hypothetical protein